MHSRMTLLRIRAILFLITFLLFPHRGSFAGTVVIKPGQFNHFTLQMPDRAVAGENFVIKVSVYDANSNLITNFSETGKEFKVDLSGSATAQPSVLNASAFSGGIANVLVSSKKAEKITFSLRESGGTVPVISRDVIIIPNKLNHFVLQSPASVTAGVAFDVKVVAKDIFDNTVSDIEIGKSIKMTSTGTSAVSMSGSGAFDFRNGLATAAFVSEKAGDVVIELHDVTSGSRGRTQGIQVNPAGLSSFKMQAPKSAVAGEPFELLVTAYDVYDNIVTNYAAVGGGLKLTTTGSSKIDPASVNPSEFRNGQATVRVVYEKAEDLQIISREANREQSGRTAVISVANAAPDHFVVLTPDSAISGQKFKVKVEAYDRFNNLVKNFNLIGNDVVLSTTGSGILIPSRIAPSEFMQGIAVGELMYDKVESFQISARMASDKIQGKVTTTEQKPKKEAASLPPDVSEKKERVEVQKQEPTKPAIPKKEKKEEKGETKSRPPKAETKKEAKPAPKKSPDKKIVAEEAPKKREAAKAEPKKEIKKDEPRKDTVKKELPKKETKEADKKAAPAEKQAAVKKVPAEAKPSDIKPMPEEQKIPAVELAKKEEKKVDRPSIYALSNVSIIEAKNKAMLVLNISSPNGTLDYGDEIESKYGKEWLKLKMKPAVNSTDKSFKFKSAYVGEVRVEEDKTGGQSIVNVFIELIPSGVTYDIARVRNTLVVTFSSP